MNFKPFLMQAFGLGREYQRNEVQLSDTVAKIDDLNEVINDEFNKWIDIDNELPSEEGRYLAICYRDWNNKELVIRIEGFTKLTLGDIDYIKQIMGVRYWRKLPELPKGL